MSSSFKDVLNTHTLKQLRGIVARMNVPNYIKVKGKDEKIPKDELIKLMVSHYTLGKTKDGKEFISRSKFLGKKSDVLQSLSDKNELQSQLQDQVEEGFMTQEEALKEYRRLLKQLKDDGAMFKVKRKTKPKKQTIEDKIDESEGKKKGKKSIAKTKSGKSKQTLKDKLDESDGALKSAISEETPLKSIVEVIVRVSKAKSEEEVEDMVSMLGYDDVSDVLEDFYKRFDSNNEFLENNLENKSLKGIKGHAKTYAGLLKKVKSAMRTKRGRENLGITDEEGSGLLGNLTGAISSISNVFGV